MGTDRDPPAGERGRYLPLVTGVVLAGGRSRRMGGGDKSLGALNGEPMIALVARRLSRQAGSVVVNANGDPARFAWLELPVTADRIAGFAGPLAGIHAGMEWARQHTPGARWIATAAADTPFFPDDLVLRLVEAGDGAPGAIVLAGSAGRIHPVFGLWPVALAETLEAALREEDARGVRQWVARHPHTQVAFDGAVVGETEIDPFFNVNTPQDMEAARRIGAALARGAAA